MQCASQALAPGAGFPIELEQHVGRADQPVLMRCVEFQRAAETEHTGSSHERDVVVVDDIVVAVLQQGSESPAIGGGRAELM